MTCATAAARRVEADLSGGNIVPGLDSPPLRPRRVGAGSLTTPARLWRAAARPGTTDLEPDRRVWTAGRRKTGARRGTSGREPARSAGSPSGTGPLVAAPHATT